MELMKNNNITKYKLSKESGIPYSTLSDIISGKTELTKCNAETVYKLAQSLNVTMEDLVLPYMLRKENFDIFKSNVCHQLKLLGDMDFILETLKSDNIRKYYNMHMHKESFYLLAMLDYLCRENNLPYCKDYNNLRKLKLKEPLFSSGVLAMCAAMQNDSAKKEALDEAIPEFKHFNIIEGAVRDVI